MSSLLDFIFQNLDTKRLSREEVKSYLLYLNEILPQLSSREDKVKFLKSKINLNKRLVELDTQMFMNRYNR